MEDAKSIRLSGAKWRAAHGAFLLPFIPRIVSRGLRLQHGLLREPEIYFYDRVSELCGVWEMCHSFERVAKWLKVHGGKRDVDTHELLNGGKEMCTGSTRLLSILLPNLCGIEGLCWPKTLHHIVHEASHCLWLHQDKSDGIWRFSNQTIIARRCLPVRAGSATRILLVGA